jgi:hypothetical protein
LLSKNRQKVHFASIKRAIGFMDGCSMISSCSDKNF